MALSQAQATTTGTGGRIQPFGQALALAAAIVAVLSVAIVATSWVAGQGAATSKADALVQSSAIQFRAGEHAVGGSRIRSCSRARSSSAPASTRRAR